MPPLEDELVRVYDDQGRKLPYSEFKAAAQAAGMPPYKQAMLINQRRSKNARIADRSFRAVHTTERVSDVDQAFIRDYYAHPNRMDVKGIDTTAEKYKARRAERVKEAFEAGGLIRGVIDVEPEELEETPRLRTAAGAFLTEGTREARLGGNEIQLRKGTPNRHDTLAHELGHGLDHRLGANDPASETAIEDPVYAESVHEASVERRGDFDEDDEYRSSPGEQFADWFAGAVQEPRYTRATGGHTWNTIEEQARQRQKERLDEMVERPRNVAKASIRDAVREAGKELAWDDYDGERVWEMVREAQAEAEERYEREGHRERMEKRVASKKAEADSFGASSPADFAGLRLGDVNLEEDPLFEGSRRRDLLPGDKIAAIEAEMGTTLDIEGVGY